MSTQLTVDVNGKTYELNSSIKQAIMSRAEREFSENWMFDCWWSKNERGDPVLNIETEGYWVPWTRLEQLTAEEMQELQENSSDDSQETEDIDNGNGVKSVPKDDVDISHDVEDDAESVDTTFMVTPQSEQYIPQPDDGNPEKVPPDPESLPDEPSLVAWVPDSDQKECWETGKALVPQQIFVSWNIQNRADEAISGATKIVPDGDNHATREPKTTSHDTWEEMCELHDCDEVEKEPSQDIPESNESETGDGYSGKEPEDTLEGKYGGDNFNV